MTRATRWPTWGDREVLEEGSLEQRKEFPRGFVAEIGIDPDGGKGVITFYELPAGSLTMVPGGGGTNY